jgi:hypothetical protein
MEKEKNINLAVEKLLSSLSGERRFHNSIDGNLIISSDKWKERKENELIFGKPIGLWYDYNGDWLKWCLSEEIGWIRNYLYEVEIDKNKILCISNVEEFERFEKEYFYHPENNFSPSFLLHHSSINWQAVREKYSGIEIIPYLRVKRLTSMWFYGWDCASGCVWDLSAFKVRLFAYYDSKKDCFVKIKQKAKKGKLQWS